MLKFVTLNIYLRSSFNADSLSKYLRAWYWAGVAQNQNQTQIFQLGDRNPITGVIAASSRICTERKFESGAKPRIEPLHYQMGPRCTV